MWAAVSARSHNPIKIFPFGAHSSEVMLYGTVTYELKADGSRITKDWAARAVLRDGGQQGWKLREYQVYLDTAG